MALVMPGADTVFRLQGRANVLHENGVYLVHVYNNMVLWLSRVTRSPFAVRFDHESGRTRHSGFTV